MESLDMRHRIAALALLVLMVAPALAVPFASASINGGSNVLYNGSNTLVITGSGFSSSTEVTISSPHYTYSNVTITSVTSTQIDASFTATPNMNAATFDTDENMTVTTGYPTIPFAPIQARPETP